MTYDVTVLPDLSSSLGQYNLIDRKGGHDYENKRQVLMKRIYPLNVLHIRIIAYIYVC